MKDKRQLLDIRVKSEEDFVLLTFRNWSLLKSGIRGRHHLYRMQDDTLYRYRFDEQGKCLELIDSLSAVSYTHLDVYKRQPGGSVWRNTVYDMCDSVKNI